MTAEEIFAGESENIEFKSEIPAKSEKYMKTVVAFANGKGGKLVFGVENGTWAVTGFSKEEVFQKMDAITNAIFDSCEPKITPNIAVQEIDGKAIIVVEIIPGMQRPYYIKSQGIMEGTYIRVAGTTRHAERYRVQELIMEGTNRSFDQMEREQTVSEEEIAAFCEKNTTRKDDVIAVAIHFDDARFDLGAQISGEILHAAEIDEGCRQEATQTDIEDKTTLDDFDDFTSNHFASLEFILDLDPSALVLCALLGEDETTIFVFLLENKCLEAIAQLNDLRRIGVFTDRKFTSRNNTFALESDINEHFIMLDLDNGAVDEIAFVEFRKRSIDHLVHFIF